MGSGHCVNTFPLHDKNISDVLSAGSVLPIGRLPATLTLKANALIKHNIDALLRARGQERKELAVWCRRSRSWIDKIYDEDRREIPFKYLDRIADFFGIATYQLLQPGISPLLERRGGRDRRSGRERRISNASAAAQPRTAVDLMDLIRAISPEGQRKAIPLLTDILNDDLRELRRQQAIRGADADQGRIAESAVAGRAAKRSRPKGTTT